MAVVENEGMVAANSLEFLLMSDPAGQVPFDTYAGAYDEALNQGLAVSGEGKDYFARRRVAWLAGCLRGMNFEPRTVLDYGCGTGSAFPFFRELLKPERVIGVDVSAASLETARNAHGASGAEFFLTDRYQPGGQADLAFCNGVFHHIPPGDRPASLHYISDCLQPGGLFAFWENNPWNPGTRYVMSRIPFDRDAVPVAASQARRLLRACGFQIVRTHYLFIFPRSLRCLRPIEPHVAWLPLGTQYQVLCRKGDA